MFIFELKDLEVIEISYTFANKNKNPTNMPCSQGVCPPVLIIGAVAYIAIIAPDIYGALDILHRGLHELHFGVENIFEIRNVYHLCECDELSDNEKVEIDWLLKSKYVFKIIDRLWPYR